MMADWFWARIQRYLPWFLEVPPLSIGRIAAAVGIAIAVDGVQLVLGPIGWVVADEILDVMAMVAISWLLGFHPLLLPTYLIELFPVADLLPTWTGCVGLVVAQRWRAQGRETALPPRSTDGPPRALRTPAKLRLQQCLNGGDHLLDTSGKRGVSQHLSPPKRDPL